MIETYHPRSSKEVIPTDKTGVGRSLAIFYKHLPHKVRLLPVIVFFIFTYVILIPTAAHAAWYDAKYQYRKAITLDGTKITGNLTGFPVLISFPGSPDPTSDALAAAGALETEFVFTDSDGNTKLDHEIEYYNPATGELVAWVEMNLTLSTDKTIYLYYGNIIDPGTDQQNATGVWDSNYVGVWHMSESPSDGVAGHVDSTGNLNTGTPQNFQDGAGSTNATGKIGGADYFAGDNDYVDCGNNAILNVNYVTAEVWVNVNTWVTNGGILAKGGNATRQYWMWTYDTVPGSFAGSFEVDEGGNVNDAWLFTSGEWHHLVLTYDGSNVITYRNGVQENIYPQTTGVIDSAAPNLLFGYIPGWFYFNGTLDEIRISNTDRPASWIQTQYNNQNDPGAFIKTVGAEELAVTLLGRYCFNEATSGQGPATVFDSEASPVDMAVTYDTPVTWSEVGGNRGLNGSAASHLGVLSGPAAGTKYPTNLDGATRATFVIVTDFTDAGYTSRAAGFMRGDNGNRAAMFNGRGDSMNFRFMTQAQSGEAGYDWGSGWNDGVRRVYHVVYDTDEPLQVDRVRLYMNGVNQGDPGAPVEGVAPAQFEALDFGDPSLVVGALNDVTALDRGYVGTVYYFAAYAGEMSDAEIAADAAALLTDDDCGAAGDTTPPDAVTDLATGAATATSVELTWTAPGDDGASGAASTYDIRYSTSPITNDTDFNNAAQATGEPAPQVAGSSENFTVTGLSAGTLYYFAIKTADEVPNTSALSNVASASTLLSGGGTIYYVRNDGNDANTGLGNSAAESWQTVQQAANTMVAGDKVYVVGAPTVAGIYNEEVLPLNSGTAGNPIIYEALGSVVLDGLDAVCTTWQSAFRLINKSYIVIDGFELTNYRDCGNDEATIYVENSSDINIRNNVIHDTGRDAINLNTGSSNVLVFNNLMYNLDDDGMEPQGSGHVLRNNTIFNAIAGEALENIGAGSLIEYNIIWDNIPVVAGTFNYNDYINDPATLNAAGAGNFSSDPLFVTAGSDFHLQHVAAGQSADSPAIDAGNVTAASLNLDTRTTRTDAITDAGTVDLGYHYPNGIVGPSYTISGTVFEDINYGGGAGRDLATADAAAVASGWAAGDIGVAAANVELYENQGGNFIKIADTAAAADGTYAFSGLTEGTYRVRVVNASVVSNRGTNGTGNPPVAVQTFRDDPDSGGAVTGEVGGAAPSLQDAGAQTDGVDLSTITAQSVTEVAVAGADVTGVDFGYNFDVIVNTNDSGQGSLRQFLLNANELDQVNLAQEGLTAGAETSIFMIPSATDPFGRPTDPNFNGSGNGEFTILHTLELPAINDAVSLDGTTQPGFVDRPLIEITGGPGSGITISANNSALKGFIVNDFSGGNGVVINGNANLIAGNWIGISAAGNAAGPGNAQDGIAIYGSNNIVGGSVVADRNVISGNGDEGIDVEPSATGNIIIGNYIGTNSAGDAAIANGTGGWSGGILFDGDGNRIGGTAPGEGNLISGNIPYGIMLHSSSNQVLGNLVGTDAAGTGNLANSGAGIHMYGSNNVIGGIAANARNTIAFSGGDGIEVANTAGTGHTISGNSIYSNGGIGIDLIDSSDLGVTANDIGDGDSGPNNLQNFPDLTEASVVNGSTTIRGSLDSAPSAAYTVEFFSSPAADASGNGEGEVYLGSTSVTTDGAGVAPFTVHLGAVVVPHVVTATATEDASGSTSEFSAAVAAAAPAVKMFKRAFETDGTSINNGGNRLKGSTVKFLIYINNRYGGLTDIDVEDVLAAEYAYQAGTLKIDNTVAACAAGDGSCTAGEENSIFAAIDDNTPVGDAVDTNDGAGFDGSATISAGTGAGNAQVDIAPDSVWALMFTATLQ